MDYGRKTQTYLIMSRMIQQCPLERMKIFDEIRLSRFPSIAHYHYFVKRAKNDKSDLQADVGNGFYVIDNQGWFISELNYKIHFYTKSLKLELTHERNIRWNLFFISSKILCGTDP